MTLPHSRTDGVDFGGYDGELPLPDPAMTLHEMLVRLRTQNKQLRAKLKKLRAKTKHHLSERDRYRDLYIEATKALKVASARHPNF